MIAVAPPTRATDPTAGVVARWSHHRHDVGPIRWRVARIGQGPLVLLVHGTGASSHSFLELGQRLAERFTVLAPDLPGHAETVAAATFEPTLPNVADALAGLLASYRDELGEPVILGGHSAGAALVAQVALAGSVMPRLLVGMGAALTPFRGPAGTLFPAMAKTLSRSSLAAHLIARRTSRRDVMSKLMASIGSASVDIEPYRRLTRRPSHVAATLKMMASWELEPLFGSLGQVAQPFLLIAGQTDRATPLPQQRAAVARMARGRLAVVPGAGHLVHEEAPDTVARLISSETTTVNEEKPS